MRFSFGVDAWKGYKHLFEAAGFRIVILPSLIPSILRPSTVLTR
jgi:hypothetical protein